MYRKKSAIIITVVIIIAIVIIGIFAYLGYNYYSKNKVGSDGDYIESSTEETIVETPTETTNANNNGEESNTIDINSIATINPTDSTDENTNTDSSDKKATYKGFETLGTIEIPKTNIKYPILAKVTKKSLETSVAIAYPENAILNSVGNIVISGHNYRNGTFFSNNKKLTKGDKIYIKDLKGNKVKYNIYKIFETTDTDVSFYNRDTNGKREITLSTCTDDSLSRLIIQAVEE